MRHAGLMFILLTAFLGGLLRAANPQDALGPIVELKLEDGTVLHNVMIIGYGNKVVTARWQGGRGTILHSLLPPNWRILVESRRPEYDKPPAAASSPADLPPEVTQGPASNIQIVDTPRVRLRGRMLLNPPDENAQPIYFKDAKVNIYPLEDNAPLPPYNPGQQAALGEPLATTQTDENGYWVMPPFPKQNYYIQAEGIYTIERSGNSTAWEWRLKAADIIEVADVTLDEDNALPVVKTWNKKHTDIIAREKREKKKTFLKRIFSWFGK